MSSDLPDATSTMTHNQLEHELDKFITQEYQLHHTNKVLTIHQLTYSASISEPSIHSVHVATTRAHRVFKREHLKPSPQLLISHPRSSRLYNHHQHHTNNKESLVHNLPFVAQYTYYPTNKDNQQNLHVYKNILFPTLSWTTYYHFTYPLGLSSKNTPEYHELYHSLLHKLTTAHHENQFTTIGLNQILNRLKFNSLTNIQSITTIIK